MHIPQPETQWTLPPYAKVRIGRGGINVIEYFPDGDRLAIASTIGIWIYDVETCEPIELITGHTGPVNSIVFAPNGSSFVTASDDNTARLWNTVTCQHKVSYLGHSDVINAVDISPDGKRIVTASDDKDIRLWNLHSGELIAMLEGHTEKVLSAVFSPDGTVIASSEEFGEVGGIRIWDAHTGVFQKVYKEDTDWVEYVIYSPDGKSLISRDSCRDINFWEADTGKKLEPCETDDWMHIYSPVAFSPDGCTFTIGVRDGHVCLWDINTRRLLKEFEIDEHLDSSPSSVAFSPDGETIASASEDGTIRFWEVKSGNITKTIIGHTPHLSSTQKAEGSYQTDKRNISVAFSPDGHTFANFYDTSLHLRNSDTCELRTVITGPRGNVREITISGDGNTLAIVDEKSARLWDAYHGRFLGTFGRQSNGVSSVTFSPDASVLATGGHDNTIYLWEVRKDELYIIGDLINTFTGHTDVVSSVVFSPDGNILVSGSHDHTVRLWDVQTGKLMKTHTEHKGGVNAVDYSSDGSILASGSSDGTIRLWNSNTCDLLETLNGSQQTIHCVAFSPNDRFIVGGTNGPIYLWNVQNGKLLDIYRGHTDVVESIAFSQDGKTLASGSYDGTVLLWDLTSLTPNH